MEIDIRGHRCVYEVTGAGPNLTLLHSDSARILHAGIPGSELAVIAGANHYPQIDHADAFNERVIGLLRRVVPLAGR